MKHLPIILVSIFFCISSGGQTLPLRPCRDVLSEISEGWKLDSLGTNGFRYSVSEKVCNSMVDKITKPFLIETLGKPQHIQKFYVSIKKKWYVGFIYYVLNRNENPKDRPFMGYYVQFVFDENEKTFLEITKGEVCG
jgi:hypothetical protein